MIPEPESGAPVAGDEPSSSSVPLTLYYKVLDNMNPIPHHASASASAAEVNTLQFHRSTPVSIGMIEDWDRAVAAAITKV